MKNIRLSNQNKQVSIIVVLFCDKTESYIT